MTAKFNEKMQAKGRLEQRRDEAENVVSRKNNSSEEEKTMNMLKFSDLEIVTGGVLDNDYIDYLTRVMFYAKRADKTLEQVLSDLRDRNCTQEALDYVVAHW